MFRTIIQIIHKVKENKADKIQIQDFYNQIVEVIFTKISVCLSICLSVSIYNLYVNIFVKKKIIKMIRKGFSRFLFHRKFFCFSFSKFSSWCQNECNTCLNLCYSQQSPLVWNIFVAQVINQTNKLIDTNLR